MAVFSEETSLYEILVRVNKDKTWSAHYQTLTEIKRDGEVISSSLADVMPVTQGTASEMVLSELMGEVQVNSLLLIHELKKTIEEQTDQISILQAHLNSLL